MCNSWTSLNMSPAIKYYIWGTAHWLASALMLANGENLRPHNDLPLGITQDLHIKRRRRKNTRNNITRSWIKSFFTFILYCCVGVEQQQERESAVLRLMKQIKYHLNLIECHFHTYRYDVAWHLIDQTHDLPSTTCADKNNQKKRNQIKKQYWLQCERKTQQKTYRNNCHQYVVVYVPMVLCLCELCLAIMTIEIRIEGIIAFTNYCSRNESDTGWKVRKKSVFNSGQVWGERHRLGAKSLLVSFNIARTILRVLTGKFMLMRLYWIRVKYLKFNEMIEIFGLIPFGVYGPRLGLQVEVLVDIGLVVYL